MADTKVRVRLVQDTETMKVSLEVSVASNAKRGMWCNGMVDADDTLLYQHVEEKAQRAAEFQCQRYGDVHDPRECGRQAVAALRDILKAADRATTRPGVKISAIDAAFDGESARKATNDGR